MRISSEHAHILHGSKHDVSPINVETTFFAKVCNFAAEIDLIPIFGAIHFIGVLFRCDVCE